MEPDLNALADALWRHVIVAIDSWQAAAEHGGVWTVRPGSSLAGDDKKSAPYQTSHAVQALLVSGVDALNGLRHMVFGRPGDQNATVVLHQAAHYSLARAALENFGTALWILHPAARSERVLRTARWHVQNVNDQHAALDAMPRPIDSSIHERSQAEKLDQLAEIAEAAGASLPAKFRRGRVPTTAIMQYVDSTDPVERDSLTSLFIWQLCSGFAHGRLWAGLNFLEREVVDRNPESEVVQLRLTSDLPRALMGPERAVDLGERLMRLYERRNTPT